MRWLLHHCNYRGVNESGLLPALVRDHSANFSLVREFTSGSGPRERLRARRTARLGSPAVGSLIAIDAGTTGVRALAVDEAGAVVDVSYREITQYFPRPGWVEHDADRDLGGGGRHRRRGGPPPGGPGPAGRRPSGSPTSARPWWPGTARRGRRSTGPSSGRTGGRRPPATPCGKPAISPSSGRRRGSSSIPTSRPPRCPGSSPRAAWSTPPRSSGDGGRLAHLESHRWDRRRPVPSPTPPTPPDPPLRHRGPGLVGGTGRDLRSPPPDPPRGRPLLRSLRRRQRRSGRSRLPGGRGPRLRGGRRPAGGALRPGLLLPGDGQGRPTGPGASSWPTSVRPARRPRRASSPPWPGTSATTAARHRWPTPWRGRSSSPGPPSSGCATASG